MPTPKDGETQGDYIDRCIPIVMAEGTAKDGSQAAAMCHNMWDEHIKNGEENGEETKAERQEEKGQLRKIEFRSTHKKEMRCSATAEVRMSMIGGIEKPQIVGYASVFDSWTDIGPFYESVKPGAFTMAIMRDDVRALWNHDPNYVLGRSTSGTLSLSEDQHGLKIGIDPPDTQFARDLMVSMKRGDISQMSFGFFIEDEEWDYDGADKPQRTLKRVGLADVSIVTYPAYQDTEVYVRAITPDEIFEAHAKPLVVDEPAVEEVKIAEVSLETEVVEAKIVDEFDEIYEDFLILKGKINK